MLSLYHIHQGLMEVLAELEDENKLDAEDGKYLDEAFCQLLKERDDKFANISALIKNFEAYRVALKTEADVLYDKAKALEKRIGNLEKLLGQYLEPGETWTNGIHSLSWRKSPGKAVPIPLDDGNIFIPEIFQRKKEVIEPDKVAIADAIKAGGEVTGWKLVEENKLQVK